MLMSVKESQINLDANLFLIHTEESKEKIYIWQRLLNPIDLKSIKRKLSLKSPRQIKTYLYNREISYVTVTDNYVEVYRDFFGISDIYYTFQGKKILFSETLEDFYHLGLNYAAVEQYQRIGFVPANSSIINDVKKVFPGEKIIIDVNSGSIENIRKSLTVFFNGSYNYPLYTFKEHFESLFLKNINSADGLLLSGGIDSALIAYFINKKGNDTVAFTGTTKDSKSPIEKERAMKTADLFCKDHQLIELNDDIFEKFYMYVFKSMDEPFADNAILGTSILAIHAHGLGVKILAEGEGGDELFGHADSIKRYLSIRKFSRHKFLQRILHCLPLFTRKLKTLNKTLTMSKKQLIKRFSFDTLSDEEFENIVFGNNEYMHINEEQEHNLLSLAYFLTINVGFEIMKNKLASYVSRCSFIAPYLEVDLLKLALSLPPKVKFERERAVIKDLYEAELGRKGYDNKKIGMTIPTAQWILNKHKDVLYSEKFYKKSEIDKLISMFESEPSIQLDHEIWRVFVLNQWYKVNEDKLMGDTPLSNE